LRAVFLARRLVFRAAFLAARLLAAIHQLQLWSESPGRSPGGAAGANPLIAADGLDQRSRGSTASKGACSSSASSELAPRPWRRLARRLWDIARCSLVRSNNGVIMGDKPAMPERRTTSTFCNWEPTPDSSTPTAWDTG
jgi:hypothetical protein